MRQSVPPRNWKIRITDILQCILKIRRFTKGYSFDDFQGDEKTIDLVLRNLEIIGEAARHVPAEVRSAVSRDSLGGNAYDEKYSDP